MIFLDKLVFGFLDLNVRVRFSSIAEEEQRKSKWKEIKKKRKKKKKIYWLFHGEQRHERKCKKKKEEKRKKRKNKGGNVIASNYMWPYIHDGVSPQAHENFSIIEKNTIVVGISFCQLLLLTKKPLALNDKKLA